MTTLTSLIAFLLLLLLPEQPMMYKKECLLYDADNDIYSGPHISECSVEFAQASAISR